MSETIETYDEAAMLEIVGPYFHTGYWDGHFIGDGDAQDLVFPSSERRASAYALEVAEGRLATRGTKYALETIRKNQTFDAAEYNPGTMVLFHQELLFSAPKVLPYSTEDVASCELPSRPTYLPDSFAKPIGVNMVLMPGAAYMNRPYLGVVAATKKSGNILHFTASTNLNNSGHEVNIDRPFKAMASKVNVGETEHTNLGIAEQLMRVNILEIIAYGSPKKHKQSIWEFLKHPAQSSL